MFHIFHLVYSLRSEDQVKNIALSTFKIFYFSIKILKIYLVGPRPTNKPTACVSALTPSLRTLVNADTRHISIKKKLVYLFRLFLPWLPPKTTCNTLVLPTSSHNPNQRIVNDPHKAKALFSFNFYKLLSQFIDKC